MRPSLGIKLTLALLFTSLAGVALSALLIRQFTTDAFDTYVLDQDRAAFIEEVTALYIEEGSWEAVSEAMRPTNMQPPTGGGTPPATPEGGTPPANPAAGMQPVDPAAGNPQATPPPIPQQQQQDPMGDPFQVVDLNNMVVIPASAPGSPQQRVTRQTLEGSYPLEIDGDVVGYVITRTDLRQREKNEEVFLASINRALVVTGLVAAGLALVLSLFFARSLTGPLREITAAIRLMAGGQLQQRVSIRSRDELGELAEAFNQMSADLAQSNQLRRQMTADIAHDLRTPLTVLTGYLEALRDGVLSPSTERFEVLHTEAQQLQRLVTDLRTLSLMDAGELDLNRQQVEPGSLLEQVAASYAHQAEAQGVTLRVQHDALPSLNVDRERLLQVLGNLVSNALRYTPQGGLVTLEAAPANGYTTLRVTDTGDGINPEHLPHIFERFYRADSAREGESSGLGLAIARSIVEAHGGSIQAASTPGAGTSFTISLPTYG